MNFKPTLLLCSFLMICLSFHQQSFAQIGGASTYQFLNLPSSARTASMGGVNIAVKDSDINSAFQNPSLLDSIMDNQFSVSVVSYFAGINFGYVGYGMDEGKLGTFGIGIHFIRYGDFVGTDSTGALTGSFMAGEYDFNLGWGKKLDSSFSVGANLKTIYSSLGLYNSFGMAVDLSGTYYSPKKGFTAAIVIKNIGSQITTYMPGKREPIPFEIQAAVSKRVPHTPFRFSITGTHLEQFDLSYINPADSITVDPVSGDTTIAKISLADKIMRHVVFGGEILIGKNLSIRLGYNYERRKELEVSTRPATAGMSYGVGLRISKFQLSYGRAIYSLAGPSNHFTLITNLSDFVSKKKG